MTTSPRCVLAGLLTVAALTAGCASGHVTAPSAQATVSPSSSVAEPTSAPVSFTGVDASVCTSVIASDGDLYQLLADLESRGTSSGHQKGQLDVLTLASTLSTFDGQLQNSELASTLSKIEADATQVKSQILAQKPVDPEPLKTHLVDAAVICQHGGVPISWYSGS